ncbi:MAG: hypothetical protein EP311_10750 [Cytophagales bacterium]|nr:MAG: hypothetical protein EP311_10750 [Cytophagales bacterium]
MKCIRQRIIFHFFFLGMLVWFSFSGSKCHAQSAEIAQFEVVVLGIKIGDLEAKKVKEAEGTLLYEAKSQVKFWFFGSVNVSFLTQSHFEKNYIVNTKSSSQTNRGDFHSEVWWRGEEYRVNAQTYEFENQTPLHGPIAWCSTKLFFEEPQEGDVFLSEVYGLSQKIKEIEPGVYEIEINGNANRYYYQSGKLEKIVLENPIKNYQIRRVK